MALGVQPANRTGTGRQAVADRPVQQAVPQPGQSAEVAAFTQVAQARDGNRLGGLFLADEPAGLGELLEAVAL
jgi:hypothetical protein